MDHQSRPKKKKFCFTGIKVENNIAKAKDKKKKKKDPHPLTSLLLSNINMMMKSNSVFFSF